MPLPAPHRRLGLTLPVRIQPAGIVLLVAVLAWLVAAAVSGLRAGSRPLTAYECQMPDGSILKIEALTTANASGEHSFTYRPPGPMFDVLLEWIGFGTGPELLFRETDPGQPGQIVVWMSRRDARTGRPLDFDWWAKNVVVDAAGNEVPDAGGGWAPSLWGFGPTGQSGVTGDPPLLADHATERSWILASDLPPFRPKAARLELQVKNTAGEVVASFDVPLPASPTTPGKQPATPPASAP